MALHFLYNTNTFVYNDGIKFKKNRHNTYSKIILSCFKVPIRSNMQGNTFLYYFKENSFLQSPLIGIKRRSCESKQPILI